MENKISDQQPQGSYVLPLSIIISSLVIAGAFYMRDTRRTDARDGVNVSDMKEVQNILEEEVIPSQGVILPVVWGDLGVKLARAGVIDIDKFVSMYEDRGVFTDEYKDLISGQKSGQIMITRENAGYLLNLFWALGLAQKSPVLDSGEMASPAFGGAQNFASTGGWTMAVGDPMAHYSKHAFFELTSEEQALVDKVSRGVYRPCCNNSTHFPDCNHGMAMLGLLELLASQGASEEEMWRVALAVNSYWFPDTYLTIASYMKEQGVSWGKVTPQEILGKEYSSASGYAQIAARVTPLLKKGGGGCGVEAGVQTVPDTRQQQQCGV